ncbi:MAG: hypothetical protein AAGM45_11785, partial [Cyanobacteria bacterium J06588_5]
PDPAVLDRAVALGRILFSQDDDLVVEANRRQQNRMSFSGVVFARQTKVSIGTCVRDLELISTLGKSDEFKDSVVFLPL